MKIPGQAATVASMVLIVVACGGRASVDDDAGHGTHDEGGSTDAGTCMPLPGCTSTTTCPSDCNTCSCVDGAWACTTLGCVVDASLTCPATRPAFGSFCQENGRSCAFGPGCGPECTCENNAWKCIDTPCPPSQCPPVPPTGSCAGRVGLSCTWGSGCQLEQCDCVPSSAGPLWECGSGACADSGSR